MTHSNSRFAALGLAALSLPLFQVGASAQTPQIPSVPNVQTPSSMKSIQTASQSADGAGWGFLKCPATGGKHEVGAGIGTVVGGVAGNRIGGEDNRVVGTAIGAGVGAAAGAWIGCRLQVGDQRRAEEARQRALAEDRNQTWSNAETGASGEVRVTRTYVRRPVTTTTTTATTTRPAQSMATLKFVPGVSVEQRYERLRGDYKVLKTSNLRAGSSTSTNIIGKLTAGQRVNVVGKSVDKPWYLIAQNGSAIGYVYSSLLTADLDRSAANTTYASNTSYTQEVSSCRVVEEIVRVSGDVTTSKYKACPTADGGWEMAQI